MPTCTSQFNLLHTYYVDWYKKVFHTESMDWWADLEDLRNEKALKALKIPKVDADIILNEKVGYSYWRDISDSEPYRAVATIELRYLPLDLRLKLIDIKIMEEE